MEEKVKRVLNVGGGSKDIPLPNHFAEYEHVLLDINPNGSPDIICDARELLSLEASQFDAVYCSHNLEHYFRHEVPKVLSGFIHVLKKNGFAQIRVPDLDQVMRTAIEKGLDIEDELYQSREGPIMVLDVLYGYGVEIEQSGQDFYAHKTGFTQKSLLSALNKAGFEKICCRFGSFEVEALAFKGNPDQNTRALLSLPPE